MPKKKVKPVADVLEKRLRSDLRQMKGDLSPMAAQESAAIRGRLDEL